MQKRIYLDNAATSWPKPEPVYYAVEQYQRENGIGFGRTTSAAADEIRGVIDRLRHQLKTLVGTADAEVVFTFNGTDALNLALHGTLKQGDHVITTAAEHNSVLRPLRNLEDRGKIEVSRLPCDSWGRVDPDQIKNELRPNTRLVCVIHSSNVTGAQNEIATVGSIVRQSPALFLVDAAQSVGSHPIEFDAVGIDLLAFPGHKGLFGPLGTGALIVSALAQETLHPIRQGGTGASSDSDLHPLDFPEAFEAGNHNVPGLVGLAAGVKFVRDRGIPTISKHKALLADRFSKAISDLPGIQVVSDPLSCESGIVAFNLGLPPEELATILDSSFRIQIRAGHHCASLIHPYIGCQQGCARVSFSFFNSSEDVDTAADAIRTIADSF